MGCPTRMQVIVRCELCVCCGACVSAAPEGTMRMVLDEHQGVFVLEILDRAVGSGGVTDR